MLRAIPRISDNQNSQLFDNHTSAICIAKTCNNMKQRHRNNTKQPPSIRHHTDPTSHSNKHAKLQCRFLNQLLQRFLMISHAFQVQISIRPIPLDRHDLQRPSEVLSVQPGQRQSISQSAHRRIHLHSHAHASLTPKSVPSFSNAFTVDVV